mgnify:CR=1 FL=1
MKKIFTFLIVLAASSSAWAQWDLTFEVAPIKVSQLTFSNCMIEVICANPNQVWTAVDADLGAGCGNGFLAHKLDVSGNVQGSFYISIPGWELHVNAIEQFWGDIFFAGSMTHCTTGAQDAFIMSIGNLGNFGSGYQFPGNGPAQVMDLLALESKTSSASNFMAIGYAKSGTSGFDPFVIVFDQGLNVISTTTYPMGGVFIPYQGVVNTEKNVTVVGTNYGGSVEKLFVMELKKDATPIGSYVEYAITGTTKYRNPSLCLFKDDLLVAAQVDASTGSDIVLTELQGSGYSMNWSKTYDFRPSDDAVQVFDNNGAITVSFGSEAYGIDYHGLMYLDATGNVSMNAPEIYQSFSAPKVVCTIQSSVNHELYYQASVHNRFLNVVEEGNSVSSNCALEWETEAVVIDGTKEEYLLDHAPWVTHSSKIFTVVSVEGEVFDCAGTVVSGFKKGAVGLEEINTLKVNVYPSQTMGTITIQTQEEGTAQVVVYTMEGRLLKSENLSRGTGVIDLAGMPAGSYLLEVTSEAGQHRQVINKL